MLKEIEGILESLCVDLIGMVMLGRERHQVPPRSHGDRSMLRRAIGLVDRDGNVVGAVHCEHRAGDFM